VESLRMLQLLLGREGMALPQEAPAQGADGGPLSPIVEGTEEGAYPTEAPMNSLRKQTRSFKLLWANKTGPLCWRRLPSKRSPRSAHEKSCRSLT
jgi:hypothetical protein